jgi:hypothetical protein
MFPEIRMYRNAERYLGSDADNLINVKNWDGVFPGDIASACHLLLRFSLLDRLADAFGIPGQPSFRPAPRRLLPDNGSGTFMRVSLYDQISYL